MEVYHATTKYGSLPSKYYIWNFILKILHMSFFSCNGSTWNSILQILYIEFYHATTIYLENRAQSVRAGSHISNPLYSIYHIFILQLLCMEFHHATVIHGILYCNYYIQNFILQLIYMDFYCTITIYKIFSWNYYIRNFILQLLYMEFYLVYKYEVCLGLLSFMQIKSFDIFSLSIYL